MIFRKIIFRSIKLKLHKAVETHLQRKVLQIRADLSCSFMPPESCSYQRSEPNSTDSIVVCTWFYVSLIKFS